MKHKHYACIVAWAEGKTVQYFSEEAKTWVDLKQRPAPGWVPEMQYRVKPEPKKYRVWESKDGITLFILQNPDNISIVESGKYFGRWITDWIEYE